MCCSSSFPFPGAARTHDETWRRWAVTKIGIRLSKAQKEELSEQALAMSCKGRPVTEIAKELDVNWKTANGLVDFALAKRDVDEDAERQRSLAHHREIVKWCWEQLEDEALGKVAQNRPAYVARIQHSQSEIDRLNNVTPPLKTEQKVDVTVREGISAEDMALLQAVEEFKRANDDAGAPVRP